MKRTQAEINAEIAALEGAKSYAPHYTRFGEDNHAGIDRQIEFLRGEIDTTSDEYYELPDSAQSAIDEAQTWLEGDSDDAPSAGWEMYKRDSGVTE